jgi:uncharacterized sulfatase
MPGRVTRALALLSALFGLALAALGVFVVWRLWSYVQTDDPDALVRKRAELAWMGERARADPSAARPNVILILFDDLGAGDFGVSGSSSLATPRIDQLAAEGVTLDTFYAPAPYCTPSRAGLLTGRWPIRTGLVNVVFPHGSAVDRLQRILGAPTRMPADEILLPEALRAAGYATAMVGKWHLGDEAPSLPNDLGFERYFGVLHSNDMAPLPLWRDGAVVDRDPIDQRFLTPRYTNEAIAWIEEHASKPFFLYVAHNYPHVPLHATPEQAGHSEAGLYGDVIADLDASVGRIVDALARLGLQDRTLVIVTSDNGPWYQGSTGALRGRKNETFEGGMRVPFVAAWPGHLPAGTRRADVAVGIDVFPTILGLAGVPRPRDRAIDGVDLSGALASGAPFPERPVLYYSARELQAVRVGRWKMHARHGVYGGAPWSWPFAPLAAQGPWLFDLARDPAEAYDVSSRHPEELARLSALRDGWLAELEANPRGWKPSEGGAP